MNGLHGRSWWALGWAAAAAVAATGCEPGTPDATLTPGARGPAQVSSAEKWNPTNSPSIFATTLEYKLASLPKEGMAEHVPWPDTYWPTYEDSINARWQVLYDSKALSKDTLSPAEKYDLAFNSWTADAAFLKLKPYSESNCADKSWDKSYYDKLGPAAKWVSQNKGNLDAHDGVDNDKDGKTDECDDRDGVESWWGLCHAWVPAALLEDEPLKPVVENGVTFEVSDLKALLIAIHDPTQAVMVGGRCNLKEVKRDEKTGRILAEECRDVNAGTYHVIMANYLGKMKRGIAEDRTWDYQVWNQPVRAWRVESMKEITVAEANKLLKQPATSAKYPFATGVKTLFEVRATTDYITESEASTKPHADDVDDFTRSDNYHYVLEVDKNGKIIGGEWLDDSQSSHPDFLWLPSVAQGSNPYVDAKKVRALAQKSHGTTVVVAPADMKEYSSAAAVDIPDNQAAGVTSTVTVPDTFAVGAKVEVEVVITHTYVGDLKVSLKHGTKTVVLQDKQGGSAHDLKKTFSVTDFTGAAAKGAWDLVVADVAASDTGKLVSWKLRVAATGGTTPTGGTVKVAATDCPKDIPDNTPAGVISTLNVTDAKTIKGVKVAVKIEHSFLGSVTVKLKHGTTEKVLHAADGTDSATAMDQSYDVTEFNGASSSGAWTLNAADGDAYNDTGKIVGWSLEIAY